MQWLYYLKQQRPHAEEEQRQLHALEREVQRVHQLLQRLVAAREQYLQSRELLQAADKHDFKASIKDICLLNDMCILELQVESSLHQLFQHTERYSACMRDYHIPVDASSTSTALADNLVDTHGLG